MFLKSGKKLLATKTLKEFEDSLGDAGFLRIHRSHVINMALISKYTKGRNCEITMKDGAVIPIARDRRDVFLGSL